jgi:hypothetical protein
MPHHLPPPPPSKWINSKEIKANKTKISSAQHNGKEQAIYVI